MWGRPAIALDGGALQGDLVAQAQCGGDQEVTAAAGWVADGEFEQCLDRTLGIGFDGIGDHWLEHRSDEFLHQAVRRVVGAGQLAGVAAVVGVAVAVIAHEGQPGMRGVGQPLEGRYQLQQAFVYAAKLLELHVPVVDAGEAGGVAEVSQLENGGQQPTVLQLRAVEPWALVGVEQAAQGRQSQSRLAAGERSKGDAQRLPEIAVPVVLAAPCRTFA